MEENQLEKLEKKSSQDPTIKVDSVTKEEIKALAESIAAEKGMPFSMGDLVKVSFEKYANSISAQSIGNVRELKQLEDFQARTLSLFISLAESRKNEESESEKRQFELKEEIKNLKNQNHDEKKLLKNQIAQIQEEFDAFKLNSEVLRDSAAKAETSNLTAQKALATAQAFNSRLEIDNERLSTAAEIAKKTLLEVTEKAEFATKSAQEKMKKAIDDKSVIEKENHVLTALNATNSKEIQRLIKEIADIKDVNESFISKLEKSSEEKNRAIGEVSGLRETIKNSYKDIESLKQEIADIRKELQESLLKNYSITADFNHAMTQMAQLQSATKIDK